MDIRPFEIIPTMTAFMLVHSDAPTDVLKISRFESQLNVFAQRLLLLNVEQRYKTADVYRRLASLIQTSTKDALITQLKSAFDAYELDYDISGVPAYKWNIPIIANSHPHLGAFCEMAATRLCKVDRYR